MKLELCSFSGFKIYPGHGRTLVKADGKTYKFLSAKTQKSHDLKRNPRKITWTVLYRRKHKKGIEEDVSKKRTRRPWSEHLSRTSWPKGTRNLRSGRPSGSRLLGPPRSRRSLQSLLLRRSLL